MTTQTPAGWYPDPYGTPQLRWWDGSQWTDAVHPLPPQAGQSAQPASPGASDTSPSRPEQQPGVTPPASPDGGVPPSFGSGGQAAPEASGPEPQRAGSAQESGDTAAGTQETAGSREETAGAPQGRPSFAPPDPQPGVGADAPTWQLPQPGQWAHPGGPGGPAGPGWPGGSGARSGETMVLPDFAQSGMHAGPPGYPGGGFPGPEARKRSVWPWVLGGGGVLVVIAAIIATVVFVMNNDNGLLAGGDPSPSNAQTLPPETPAPATPEPVPSTPTPSPTPSGLPQIEDGRITDPVTGLSYEVPEGDWTVPPSIGNPADPLAQRWTSAVVALSHEKYDGQGDWIGNVYTGELQEIFPYTGPESLRTTVATLFHYYTARFYSPPHEQKILENEEITVGDRKGWLLKFELDFSQISKQNDWKWKKERGAIVLIDRAGLRPALLYASVPDNLDMSNVERVLDSLKLE